MHQESEQASTIVITVAIAVLATKGELAVSVTRESITTVVVTTEKAVMIVADVLATEAAAAAAS